MLPRELWIYILKINWFNARVKRLEKILKYPRRMALSPLDYNDDSDAEQNEADERYIFRVGWLYWEYSKHNEDSSEHFERWNQFDWYFTHEDGYIGIHEEWSTPRRFWERGVSLVGSSWGKIGNLD